GGCAVDRRLQEQQPRGQGSRRVSRPRAGPLSRAAGTVRQGARGRRKSDARAVFPAARRLERVAAGMDPSTALALLASAFLGTAVVIANVVLRYLDPARGALVSIPSTTLLFWLLAVFLFRGEGSNATAVGIFAQVGLIFPALVTYLNFASNRLTGPTVAGTISSTTPLFAVLG